MVSFKINYLRSYNINYVHYHDPEALQKVKCLILQKLAKITENLTEKDHANNGHDH